MRSEFDLYFTIISILVLEEPCSRDSAAIPWIVFQQLADQTNLFNQYLKENSNKPLPTFKETTVPEIMAFLGMHIAMGLGRLPIYDNYGELAFYGCHGFLQSCLVTLHTLPVLG